MSGNAWDEIKNFPEIVKGEWPTIPELFEMSLKQYPKNTCFAVIEREKITITYEDEYREIMKTAALLVNAGLKKGDRVLLNGKNSREWATAYLATQFAGCTLCPIDNQMNIKRVAELGEFAECKFVFGDLDILNKLEGLESEWFKALKGVVLLKGKSDNYRKVYELEDIKPLEKKVEVSEHDIATILFTSGTTGNEKGALLTHRNITSNVYQAANGMNVTDKDVLYALLPLHHSYCCTAVFLESIKHGATCLFGHGIVLSRMIKDLKEGPVTVFMGIPLLYNKFIAGIEKKVEEKGWLTAGLIKAMMHINLWCKLHLKCTPFNNFFKKKILSQIGLDHAKILISGAGPLSPDVVRKYQSLGLNFLQGYGLTETSPIVSLNPPEHFKMASVGKVLNFIEAKIADPNSEGVGEIRVKGVNICKGYLNDPENTAALFDEDGYLKTGDLGYIDEENYIYIKGRSKNIIVTEGGKNVFPEEIEDMFQLYSEIDQIMIRGFQAKPGVPSEEIEAVIHLSDDYRKQTPDKDEQKKHVEEVVATVNKNLAHYKKIQRITILEEAMEMTTTKKIKRRMVK